MSQKIIVAGFEDGTDLVSAVRAVREIGWEIADIYMPYPLHNLDPELGWHRSRLSIACFFGGAAGATLALWFQFWASATDWPLNVGGRPWNSLPAFVPVVFECMVLFAGFTLLFAWLFRCRLYPGKQAVLPLVGVTDNRFALVLHDPGSEASARLRELLQNCRAGSIEERVGEELS